VFDFSYDEVKRAVVCIIGLFLFIAHAAQGFLYLETNNA